MKLILKSLFLFCCSVASYSFGQPCEVPHAPACAFLNPNIAHVFVEINFKKNVPDQIVYINMGCAGIHELTPIAPTKNIYPDLNMTLELTLCARGRLINVEKVELGSNNDMAIICDYTDKLICKNHPKKKSSWERLPF